METGSISSCSLRCVSVGGRWAGRPGPRRAAVGSSWPGGPHATAPCAGACPCRADPLDCNPASPGAPAASPGAHCGRGGASPGGPRGSDPPPPGHPRCLSRAAARCAARCAPPRAAASGAAGGLGRPASACPIPRPRDLRLSRGTGGSLPPRWMPPRGGERGRTALPTFRHRCQAQATPRGLKEKAMRVARRGEGVPHVLGPPRSSPPSGWSTSGSDGANRALPATTERESPASQRQHTRRVVKEPRRLGGYGPRSSCCPGKGARIPTGWHRGLREGVNPDFGVVSWNREV